MDYDGLLQGCKQKDTAFQTLRQLEESLRRFLTIWDPCNSFVIFIWCNDDMSLNILQREISVICVSCSMNLWQDHLWFSHWRQLCSVCLHDRPAFICEQRVNALAGDGCDKWIDTIGLQNNIRYDINIDKLYISTRHMTVYSMYMITYVLYDDMSIYVI